MDYIKCVKGQFVLVRNYRDAFDLEKFIEKYLEEYFNKYPLIVGDLSSSILRLKGFDDDNKINDYLDHSCAFGCPFYVLKKVHSYEEFQKYVRTHKEYKEEERVNIHNMEKENFDKESLILETSEKQKPRFNIDMEKINSISIGTLPKDLIEAGNNYKENKKVEPEVEMQTYVSASPDFDPSLKEKNKNKKNRDNHHAKKRENR